MVRSKLAAALAASLICGATAAHAEDANRWFVQAGPAIITMDENATFTAAGQPVPGANVKINPQYTIEAELGYFVTPNVALAVAGGIPPMSRVHAAGSVEPLGVLGRALYGPSTATVQYHWNREGKFQPYVGAGAAFLIIFKTHDGAVTDLKAKNDVGEAVQVGFDYMVNDKWGGYFDAKQTWLKTTTTGFLGGAPVVGKVRLNPAAFTVGVVRRF